MNLLGKIRSFPLQPTDPDGGRLESSAAKNQMAEQQERIAMDSPYINVYM